MDTIHSHHHHKKVIVILGTTGVGKTKLSVELAEYLGAQIISADSMQVYSGLPIATNQATQEEKKGVVHHLLDYVSPLESTYNVHVFVNDALSVMESLGDSPVVIVGGTHWYIEELLWESTVINQIEESPVSIDIDWDHDDLYHILQKIDPERCIKLHPNERRKIRRSIEIYYSTGKKHSELLKMDSKTARFDPLLIWLSSSEEILNNRIERRTNKMIEEGILNEVEQLWNLIKEHKESNNDELLGIQQAIGYREFIPYLTSETKTQEEFEDCIEQLKRNTKNYAKKQIKWIKNHLIPRSNFVLEIDTSLAEDTEIWRNEVYSHAKDICDAFLKGEEIPHFDNIKIHTKELEGEDWKKYECETCNRILNGQLEWDTHMKSKPHKKRLANIRKREKNELARRN
eukprot:TRINITY_DN10304_c0_g1_i1.p1 TRINITY_DN10304_c0_g1~~TRINITY_DN10304_c0_g1_i1.p1  ORF type:complete len:402 (-),score=83.12 TRINITY_DN10304_c0_g1_i1:794-1999(-)